MNRPYLKTSLGVSAACLALAAAQSQSKAVRPSLMGTVRDAEGKPLNGVAVSARSGAQTFTTSVYTDERGVYVFPHIDDGDYQIRAQAVKFSTGRAETRLGGSGTTKLDIAMKPLADYETQLTGYEWFHSLPDDSREHRRIKQVMYVACTGCHSLDVVLQIQTDENGWRSLVKSMETTTYNGWRGTEDMPAEQLGWEGQIIRYHRNDLAKYLAEVRGPKSTPLAYKTLDRPTGDAARVVVTEYDLPINPRPNEMPWYNGADWTMGPSTGMHGIVGVHDVLIDNAGIAWITQSRTTFETNRSLVRLDPRTGDMKAIRLADGNNNIIFVEQVGADPTGNIWMHSGTQLIRLRPATEEFTMFAQPGVMGGMANSTDSDSRGRIFINGRFGVTMFDPAEQNKTGVMYPGWHLYQQLTPGNGTTYGISADREDNVWWSESYADKVATRDMKTGKVSEFDMHDPEYEARKALMTPADLAFYDSIGAETWAANSAEPLPYANMPRRLAADKNGTSVWIPNWADSNVAEIDIHTHKVTYHKLPIQVHPYKTIVAKNHSVYTDTSLADAVFKYAPATGAWTMYRMPSRGCGSRHVSFDEVQGELWLPCDQSGKVARFRFRNAEELRALERAAAN